MFIWAHKKETVKDLISWNSTFPALKMLIVKYGDADYRDKLGMRPSYL